MINFIIDIKVDGPYCDPPDYIKDFLHLSKLYPHPIVFEHVHDIFELVNVSKLYNEYLIMCNFLL